MPSLNPMARNITLVFLTGVIFAVAASASVQGKALWPTKISAVRIEHQQDSGRARPTPLPLINWLARANDLKLRGQVDLSSNAELTVDAKLNYDCRLSDIAVAQKSGDPRLVEVVESLVAAVGDSGLLTYVGDRGNESLGNAPCIQTPLRFNFSSDSSEIAASLEYPATSAERAVAIAKAYSSLIVGARIATRGHTDELIANAMTAASDGSQVNVRFRASRTAVDEMIRRLLGVPKT